MSAHLIIKMASREYKAILIQEAKCSPTRMCSSWSVLKQRLMVAPVVNIAPIGLMLTRKCSKVGNLLVVVFQSRSVQIVWLLLHL